MTKPTKTKPDLLTRFEDDVIQFRDALFGELGRLRAETKPNAIAKRVGQITQEIRRRLSGAKEKD